MLMYKLLKQDMTSYNGMKWEIGKTNKATAKGTEMCTNQVLHCYSHPVLALLFNPIHANIGTPRLFVIECSEIVANDGLKYACKEQTPKKELIPPSLTTEDRVEFAIRIAMKVHTSTEFQKWGINWINGVDRSWAAARAAAREAAGAAEAAAREAAGAAWAAAREAAREAARAAEAAAWAAAREAETAAWAAAWAAGAAETGKADLFMPALQECSFYSRLKGL